MKIAFIGSGQVGGALAKNLERRGHEVILTRRGSIDVSAAEVVFLATPFAANQEVLAGLDLTGKVLVDCTNPVGPGLTHGLKSERSGAERVAELAPGAKVVKAFGIYGFENLEDPSYPAYNVKPAMLFCGNDGGAKEIVARLIVDLGFEPVDVGGLEQALHLEHMTLLWVRMVRADKRHSPHLVWAALRR